MNRRLATSLAILVMACNGAEEEYHGTGEADLGLGDVSPDDMKADGTWGSALTCKTIPNLPPLPNPKITISLQGLTLHLVDTSVGYDRVFPIGAGQIDTEAGSYTQGDSLSYYPIKAYKK